MKLKEIDFYQEISEIVAELLEIHLPPTHRVAYTHNQRDTKTLNTMVRDLERQLGLEHSDHYWPDLSVDALVGVSSPEAKVQYIVLEIKYQNAVSLMEFSQLVGYLQVGRHVQFGLLISVVQPGKSAISGAFKREVSSGALPMSWRMIDRSNERSSQFDSGIVTYPIGGQARFVDSSASMGISSPEALAKALMAAL